MSKRILVVDRSGTIQMLLSTYFTNSGHYVIARGTPQDALRVLDALSEAPDLIFLAVHVDEKAAYQVIRYVKGWASYEQTQMVVMVSQEDQAQVQRTLAEIPVHYLLKPFHIQQALAFVGRDHTLLQKKP